MTLNSTQIDHFRRYIYAFYESAGRTDLPWRQDFNPYKILVSEIMLQQTQVERVIPKFNAFIEKFPDFTSLAEAPVGELIIAWQGLGYNRRVLHLQKAAQTVVVRFHGQLPQESLELLSLPGIGTYTAAAIQAFAFNQPSIVVETNIRTVYIFHFFHGAYKVTDQEILPYIHATLDLNHPREWYSALMDYGTYLKTVVPNPTRQSKKYVRQAPLKGSNREVRGKILKILARNSDQDINQLITLTEIGQERLIPALIQLTDEGFISFSNNRYRLV